MKAAGFSAPAAGLVAPEQAKASAPPRLKQVLPEQALLCLPKHMLDPALEQYCYFSWHYMRLLFMESSSSAFVRQG